MLKQQALHALKAQGRTLSTAISGDETLGPLKLLPGTWKNVPGLPGRGWNMIALPFATDPQQPFPFNYRLLLNQYNEELNFTIVDKAIPNRGIQRSGTTTIDSDQTLVGLDYEQRIEQVASDDAPHHPNPGPIEKAIHHEPGLWLLMLDQVIDGLNVARLATIPHGDSVLALGRSSDSTGAPAIPDISGLPIGVRQDIENNPYLGPYKAFHGANKFKGLFDPVTPNDLLREANQGVNIVRTTILDVDTDIPTGGIVNIPFIVKQANATSMKSTFWIQELAENDQHGNPKLRLQYSQVVLLDFFQRADGVPGLIRWPHVSINTLEKVIP